MWIGQNSVQMKHFVIKFNLCLRYHRNLKKNTLVFIGTVPLANYQAAISAPAMKGPARDEYPSKPADPTYGGYPSGYPAYAPGSDGGGYPSVPPTAPELPPDYSDGAPAQIQTNALYPNLREYHIIRLIFNKRVVTVPLLVN